MRRWAWIIGGMALALPVMIWRHFTIVHRPEMDRLREQVVELQRQVLSMRREIERLKDSQ